MTEYGLHIPILVISGISLAMSVFGIAITNIFMCKKSMNKNQKFILRLSTCILAASACSRLLEVISSCINIADIDDIHHKNTVNVFTMLSMFIDMNIGIIINATMTFITYVFINTTRLILKGTGLGKYNAVTVVITVVLNVFIEFTIVLTCIAYMLSKYDIDDHYIEYASAYIGTHGAVMLALLVCLNVAGSIVLRLIDVRGMNVNTITTGGTMTPRKNTIKTMEKGNNVSANINSHTPRMSMAVRHSEGVSPCCKTFMLKYLVSLSAALYFAGNIVIIFENHWNYLRLISLILLMVGMYMFVGTIMILYHPMFNDKSKARNDKKYNAGSSQLSISTAPETPTIIVTQHE